MNTLLRFFYSLLLMLGCSIGVTAQCVVTNTSTNIATAGSFKYAIANCGAGGTITFNIAGAGPHTIPVIAGAWPNGPLGIDKQLHIQGPNQNGAEIIINGQGTADAFSVGWWDAAPAPGAAGTIIEGLTIVNSVVGISVGPVRTDNITIRNMKIGVRNDGTVVSNSSHGIIVNGNPANPVYAPFIGAPVDNLKILNSVISGNLQNGIQLGFVTNSEVSGNKIGTNAAGTACAVTIGVNVINPPGGGNGYDGILFDQTTNSIVRNNVISCNGHATNPTDNTLINGTPAKYLGKRGVYFQNSDNNTIAGNMIGTNLAGEVKLPNYKSGILISSGSDNNIIGGITAADRNIISGNGIVGGAYAAVPDKHGIVIDNGGLGASAATGASTDNKIIGNYIGLSNSGLPLGNAKNGVEIIGNGFDNEIGGTVAGSTNVISGNGENGISIGQGASSNKIEGNLIGTRTDGTFGGVAYGNVNVGIQLNTGNDAISTKDLNNNTIINNIIGQSTVGIQTIGDAKVNTFIVKGNLIGQDIAGASLPNSTNGILIQTELTGFELGGVLASESNVIVNSTQSGINIAPPVLSTSGAVNVIYNNYIGVLKNGTVAKNGLSGIETNDKAYNITIGGTATNQANIIGGNDQNGVFIGGGDAITIDKNFIGLLADGTTAKGNKGNGIQINGTTNTIVQNSQIAFNGTGTTGDGILITGATSTFTIEDNLIGTVTAMTTNQNNKGFGINISGGLGTVADNKVAYNLLGGLNISSADGLLTVENNIFGTMTAISPEAGISVSGGTNNQFLTNTVQNHSENGVSLNGGTNLLSDNTVKDNNKNGVYIGAGTNTFNSSTGRNTITDNNQDGIFIAGGTNIVSNSDIENNTQNGIYVDGSTTASTTTFTGNTIASNTESGLVVSGSNAIATIGNATLGNQINSNGENGVVLNATATGIRVDNNTISLNGTGATLNTGNGIVIDNADNNLIGTTVANTISNNEEHGIYIGNTSAANTIQNNIIDDNGLNGITLISAGTANAITENTITNSTENGLFIQSTTGTTVTDNTIGTVGNGNTLAGVNLNNAASNTFSGNTIQSNVTDGVILTGSSTNTFTSNTIGANTGNGVFITGTSNANTFESNNIGVTTTGTNNSNGAGKAGIQVNGGTGNIIGTTGNPNVFGGTTQDYGVFVNGGTGTKIDYNYFGTKSAATADVSTALNGILVSVANVASINENVFSYTGKEAVKLTGASRATTIDNNFFGVDNNGTTILTAGKPATAIIADGLITGTAITNNIIPSTTDDAIILNGVSTTNSVTGNKIGVLGTNAAGAGNATGDGIVVRNSTSALTISANIIGLYNNGIHLTSGTTNKTISGNFIGTDAALSLNDLGNISNGILVDGTSNNNIISTNTIANNGEGTNIALGTGNLISQNSTYCNGTSTNFGNGTGISLSGGNNNFMSGLSAFKPVITTKAGVKTLIIHNDSLVKYGLPNLVAGQKVEIFENDPDCDNCQGKAYSQTVTFSSTSIEIPVTIATTADCKKYVFTVTDASNNTSPFSSCSFCGGCSQPITVDLTVSPNDTVCNGGDFDLGSSFTPATGYNVSWYKDNNEVVAQDNLATFNNITFASGTSSTYKLRVWDNADPANKADAACYKEIDTILTILNLPTATIAAGPAVCLGDSATLTFTFTGESPYTFTYTDGTTPVTVTNHPTTSYTKNVAPAVGNTSYSVTAMDDKFCSATSLGTAATVTVNPLPVITVTEPTPTCETAVALPAAPAGQTYQYKTFDFGSIVTSPVADSGTYQIIANITATGCKDTASILVSIHKNPTLATKTISPVCAPLEIDLVSGVDATGTTGTLSYHVSQTDADSKTAALVSTEVSEGATPTVKYFVRSEKVFNEALTSPVPSTTCFVTDDIDVTINPKPVMVGTPITGVCKPGSINLTLGIDPSTTSGLSYTYQKLDFTPASQTVSDSGSYLIIGVNAATTCGDTLQVQADIFSLPVVTASSNSPVCVGDAINLVSTSNVAASFAWTGPSSYTDATQNPSLASATLAMDGIYTVEATNSTTSCKNTATTTVLVKAKPTPVITNVTNECFNAIASARKMSTPNVVGNSYKWVLTPVSGNAAIVGSDALNTIDLNYLNFGTVNVQVTETVGTCTEVATAVLTIQDTARYTLSLPAACEYVTNYDLAANTPTPISVTGATYSSGNGQFLRNGSPMSSPLDLTTLPTGINKIEYRYTLGATEKLCVSKVFADLVVNPKPAGLAFAPSTPLCQTASPITLSGTSTTVGTTATYSGTGVTGNQFDPASLGGTTSTIFYKATVSTTGCKDSVSATIAVTAPGDPLLAIKQDSVRCQGDAVLFTLKDLANVITGSDVVEWRLNNPSSPAIHQGLTYTAAKPTEINNNDVLYVKVVPSAGSCTNPATKTLTAFTVKVPDITDVIIDPLKVCLGEFFTLGASATNLETRNSFDWFKVDLETNDTVTLSGGQNITDAGDKVGAFKYFVKVTNYVSTSSGDGLCSSSDPTNIVQVVDASITALAGPSKDALLQEGSRQVQGRPIILDARHPQDGQQYENYAWTLVSVENKNINESVASTKQASHTPVVEDGDKNLVYQVSANIAGLATCSASDTVSVRLIGNCFVPNGFSPNGDGANDAWSIKCLTDGDYPNAIVKIYNRWGELIYKDDRGGVIPWDGTRNGNLVPIGTYYFVIDLNFEDIEQIAGAVAIMR